MSIKMLISLIWFLDNFHTALIWVGLWIYLIQDYGRGDLIDLIPWCISMTIYDFNNCDCNIPCSMFLYPSNLSFEQKELAHVHSRARSYSSSTWSVSHRGEGIFSAPRKYFIYATFPQYFRNISASSEN
ncbi:hypothetical protein FB45DRAFT_886599, partial [Roridomyces roridus]